VKFLCYSDVHLDEDNDPTNSQYELFISTAKWIRDTILAVKPDYLVNLGDTVHRDGGMSTKTVQLFFEFFEIIKSATEELGIPHFVLTGNHDIYQRDGVLHVMNPLRWTNAQVIDTPTLYNLKDSKFDLKVGFYPYSRSSEEFATTLAAWEPNLVFIHMDIVDGYMNSGVKSSTGVSSIHRSTEIYDGHYHLPQNVGSVTVVGAPQYTQFRDLDPFSVPRRGMLLIEKETAKKKSKLTRITNPHTKFYGKFVSDSNDVNEVYKQYVDWYTELCSLYPHGSVTQSLQHIWFSAPAVVLGMLESNFRWEDFGTVKFTPNDVVARVDESTPITVDMSNEAALTQYAEEAECSCGGHNLEIGKQLLKRAEDYAVAKNTGKEVKFVSLEINNFMSFEHAEVPLADKGFVLVEGVNKDDPTVDSNGSGKSAIAEALLWVLFDRTARGIKADEIIKRGSKKAQVKVEFTVDGKPFIVTRERTKGKPVARVVSDKDLTPHDQREVNDLITSILGIGFDQFLLMVVFSQGFDTRFSSMSDTERKELLESYLGIEVYEQAKLLAATEVKAHKEEKNAVTYNIAKLETQLVTLQNHVLSVLEAKEKAEKEAKEELVNLEAKIALQAKAVAAASQPLAGMESSLTEAKALVSEAKATTSVAKSSVELERTEVNAIAGRISKGQGMVAQLRSNIHLLKNKKVEDTCPTCKQSLPVDSVQEVLNHNLEEIATSEAKCQEYEGLLMELEIRLQEANEKLESAKASLKECEQFVAEREATVNKLQLAYMQQKSEVQQQKALLEAYTEQHKAKRPTAEHFDVLLAEANEKTAASAEELEDSKSKLVTVEAYVHEYEYWESAFDPTGVRSVILRNAINSLNEILAKLCGTVTGNSFMVQLSSTKELKSKKEAVNKIDILVTPDGSYKSSSGGERRKIDLILNTAVSMFAKSMSGFSTNILVADEVLDNLDLTASQHVLTMFDEISKGDNTVLLISHNPSVKPLIPTAWTVVKSNQTSTLQIN